MDLALDLAPDLSADERPVLLLLAVAASPMARSYLLPCFKTLGLRRSNGRAVSVESIGDAFTALAARGLVTYASSSSYASLTLELAWSIVSTVPRATVEAAAAALRQHLPLGPTRAEVVQRELQLALLDRDAAALERAMDFAAAFIPGASRRGVLRGLPDAVLAHVRGATDPRVLALVAADRLRTARQALAPADDLFSDLAAAADAAPIPAACDHELARQLILRGRFTAAEGALARHPSDPTSHALSGWIAAARGDRVGASEAFGRSLGKGPGLERTRASRGGPECVVHALVDLADPGQRRGRRVVELHGFDAAGHPFDACRRPLAALERVLRGGAASELALGGWTPTLGVDERSEADAWHLLCTALASVVADKPAPTLHGALRRERDHAVAAGLSGWAGQLGALIARLDPQAGLDAGSAPSLLDLFPVVPAWERHLERLERAVAASAPPPTPAATKAADAGADTRLVWILATDRGRIDIHPREQRRDAKGRWSKGRRVALEHLHGARPTFAPLTDADRAVCRCVSQSVDMSSGYRDVSYHLEDQAAFGPLAAHAHVYWQEDQAQRITFREAEPSLHVTREGGELVVRLEPAFVVAGARLRQTGPYEVAVIRAREVHESVGAALGEGLRVPVGQTARIERVLAAVRGAMVVHSDIGAGAGAAEEVAADARMVVQLAPLGEGLEVQLRVRPLGPTGPAVRPGQGAVALSAVRDGRPVATTRDVGRELANGEALLAACPAILAGAAGAGGAWEIPDRATSLELVVQLGALGDAVVVEWPAGKALRVVGTAAPSALRLRVTAGTAGWFALSGALTVDEARALELGELLRLVADSPHRFVALGEDRFLALTERFAHQLAVLARVTERRGRGGVALHPWAVGAVEALAEAAAFEATAAWREQVRARHAAWRAEPVVPSTLQATLRGYQRDGFAWLARLAQLGAGACLADDMGLGKTLQALALLVHRAPAGAQLVVCPTSVVGGWLDEAARFAPTLRVRAFGAGDRAAAVAAAGPFDVVVASYGLLQSEAATLSGRRWETVVLDEAQAIKNPDALRAKAACGLDAGFRVALTGTPVENRLDELWSLFEFLVPGLLGTRAGFQARFARPIDAGDGAARGALRQLVRPLLLRRLKSEVLDELPEKTEMQLRVELGVEEAALYEAVRRQAVASLAAHADQPSGQRRVRVLAEIMRLRRACCHPRLVLPAGAAEVGEGALGSAKLAAFAELVEELRDGGHRALVYSQFVDHLAVVREWLDAEGVAYQYLDGSTPQRARQERVRAFQAGEGELFLISLRAGGTGLNLTGADFVIHLDPWWNPAVEDQASDRAHRIGQERPVTVVRLIARGTVEERIVALHRTKRALAEDLLAGADVAGRLGLDDLVALLVE